MDIEKELDSCQSIDDLMGKNGLVQRLICPKQDLTLQSTAS